MNNLKQRFFRRHSLPTLLALVFGVIAAGCSDTDTRAYRVPKEPRQEIVGHQHELPHLHWELPAGWEEQPTAGMRAASFRVTDPGGRLADVAIIPLRGVANIELDSVNMWRQELDLEPLQEGDLEKHRQAVEVGGVGGQFYDILSTNTVAGRSRTIGVILPRREALWFIKMTGENKLVGEQKDRFLGFLKTLEFHEGAHGAMAARKPVSTNTKQVPAEASLPKWTVPAHWQERPPGSMVLASYAVSSEQGQADITVSKLAGEGGGLLANVNRWRGQLGLDPIGPEALSRDVTQVEVDADKVPLVDLRGKSARSGNDARMLTVVVSREGETWFYKLMGDPVVVEKEKPTFIRFVQSAY